MKRENRIFGQFYHQQRSCAWALLFLRLFIGGVVLLHIIGVLQNYDNEVLSYRHLLELNAATSLAIVIIVEGLMAAMIILGVGTRFAAAVMLVISLLSIIELAMGGELASDMTKVEVLYVGIYITLLIAGGGSFAFNVPYERGGNDV